MFSQQASVAVFLLRTFWNKEQPIVGSVIKLWDVWALHMCARERVFRTTCPDGWDVLWSDTQADESSDRPWRLSHQSETRAYEYSRHRINANLTPSLLSIRSQISVYNVRAATCGGKIPACQGHEPRHFTTFNWTHASSASEITQSMNIKHYQMRTEKTAYEHSVLWSLSNVKRDIKFPQRFITREK